MPDNQDVHQEWHMRIVVVDAKYSVYKEYYVHLAPM